MSAQDKLKTFILRHKIEKGKPFTNTSIGYPKVSLYISDEEYEDFLNIYSLAITNGANLYLTEKPIEPSPLRVDLDFRFPMPVNENGVPYLQRVYTDDNLFKIIGNSGTDKSADIPPSRRAYFLPLPEYRPKK